MARHSACALPWHPPGPRLGAVPGWTRCQAWDLRGAFALDFTFVIALTPAASAGDWPLAQALLGLTLASLQAQTQGDFRIVIAGHDRPALPPDPRIVFLAMDWPVEPPGPHNDDSGRKKHWLSETVLQQGGGLMMIVDADDWVDRRTVERARELMVDGVHGGLITRGEVVDLASLRSAPLPHPAIFGDFHRVCGTSTVTRLRPGAEDALRRDPFSVLRSHHGWLEQAEAVGAHLVELPVSAAYLIGTAINHSDLHGPHADWRCGFRAAVNRHGAPVDAALLARYGLEPDAVRTVSAKVAAVARDG